MKTSFVTYLNTDISFLSDVYGQMSSQIKKNSMINEQLKNEEWIQY